MRSPLSWCVAAAALLLALAACKGDAGASQGVHPKAESTEMSETKPAAVGSPAPEFTVPDDSGTPTSLASFRDQRAVLLAFYPADFTGG